MNARADMAVVNAADDAGRQAIVRALLAAVEAARRVKGGPAVLGECLAICGEYVAAGAPPAPGLSDMRQDAEWWADIATPAELEAYAAAALKRIERATFAPIMRKRLLVMLLESLTAQEREKFFAKYGGKKKTTPRG